MFAEFFYSVRDFVIGPNVDERRIVPRVRCDISLSCHTPQGAQLCTLKDLSACGARLAIERKWIKGQQVVLMPPKGLAQEGRGVKATVMWVRPVMGRYQVGLKFRSRVTGSWVEDIMGELGLSPTIPKQRRSWARFPGDIPLHYVVHGTTGEASLKNLSMGGVLLCGKQRLSSGVPIQVFLPAIKLVPQLDLVGTICGSRQTTDGAHETSVKFTQLTPQQKKSLVKHLNELMNLARAR